MSDRFFRTLLKLLPAEFRGDYQREIEATFRAERREARSAMGLARVWIATLADIFRTAPGEHLDILARDLRYTLRMLARRPVLTLAATLTLALGIGANTAIFSVVNGVLFAPLPYADADRLVLVEEREADEEPGTTGFFSFDRLRSQQSTLDWMAAFGGWSVTLTGDGKDAERLVGTRVSWEYFRALGLRPVLGRDFERQDDHPQRRRQLLLSDELWRRRYNADPSILGKPITANGVTYVVIGVMPPVRELVSERLYPGTEVWTLLGYSTELPQACRTCRHIRVIGRVKQGVERQQAEADLTRIYQSLAGDFPRDYSHPAAVLTPIRSFFLGPIQQPLLLLWGAVGLLLLMACANIANLLLIRASERQEEIAIRKALGVTSTRLVRQLLTESLVLAVFGGVAGALLAWWGTRLIASYGPEAIPRIHEIAVDGTVLIYAMGITLLTGVVFGIAPARIVIQRASGSAPAPSLHGVRQTTGPTAWRYRAALIAVNVALSALLLVGSGLLVRSFLHLLAVEPGFNAQGLLTFQVDLSGQRYSEQPAITQFYDELSDRLSALADVESVGASTQLPLSESTDRWGVTIEGRPLPNPAAAPEADRYGITRGYFAAMNIPLIRGRLLTPADTIGAAPVVVIGKTMADQLWPGEDPIGRRITLAGGPDNPPRTIVGVVGDVRHYGLHLPATIQAYMPRSQAPWIETSMTMVVRVKNGIDPLSVAAVAREQVRAIDPLQPVTEMRTYDAILAKSMATRRFTLALLGIFAATALVLAIVGLYGALSYVVSQRRREIGVRVALGAAAADIRRMVVGQGMRPVAIGLLGGVVLALTGGRLLDSLLFSVPPTDLVTFAIVLAVVAASALAACLLPASRAATIDPATTLRAE
jgi:putative ABC transport system permease protein